MSEVELLIAGGGFAGLCCAKAAAVRGVQTLVLERQRRPGARVHTTGILVKEVADAWDVPRALTHKIHGVRVYSPSLRALDFRSPGYHFLATDTPRLLQWLDREAQAAGATIRHGTSFARRAGESTRSRLALVKTAGRVDTVEYRFLVGADGARSQVAKAFSLGRNRQYLSGVEIEFEGVRGVDPDYLHVFVDADLAPGYIAWVVPGVGITQVGLAVRYPGVARVKDFIAKVSPLMGFDDAREVGRRAGLIPCGGVVTPFAGPGVMLIGDAAGMVSPLTAGGIHSAMHVGRAAGIAVGNHLVDGEPDVHRALARRIPSFFFKQMLRRCFDVPVPNWVYERLLDNRAVRAAAQNVFFHHRGLLSLRAWRDMVCNDAARESLLR